MMIVELDPAVADLAPGDELAFEVLLTNDGEQPVRPSLRFDGIAPEQIVIGSVPDELPVGASTTVPCVLSLPADADAGDRYLRVTVRDLNGWTPAVTVGLALWVGDRPDVSLQILPPATTGRRSGAMTTVVHNRSTDPVPLTLDGDADALAFGFSADDVIVRPGEELEIDTSVLPVRRTWFREVRHGGLIRVRGDGPPVSAPMTFTQRPFIPPLMTKIVAAITVLAVWAAAVIVVVDYVGDEEQDPTKLLALSPAAAEAFARADAPLDAPGLVPTTQRGPGPVVEGAVTGPTDPAGTTIVLERVAFGDQGTTSGTDVKLAAFTPVQQQIGTVLDRIETTTDEQGNFRIADGLQLPGFYRVTALRAGYEVASQVVTLSEEFAQAEVALELIPASGGLSGTVRDENGSPIGGADIEVTDGSLAYTATSATEGSVGSWSIGGVAAPSVYEVVASARGYASASLRVPLDGGQQAAGIDAVLQGGLGTIRGRVSNRGEGVGAVTVDLVGEDNDVERTTTTVTDDELAGGFDIPALPFGTYLLTFSGEGWLTQTTQVVVDRGDVEVAISDLRSATAVLQGTVHQEVLPGGSCAYPDPERPGDRDRVQLEPCGGVGVSVIGADQTWRTTSASGTGTFQISRVPPGEYLVRFERAGYVAQFYEVAVDAGDVVTLPDDASTTTPDSVGASVVAMRLTPELDRRAGRIQGVIRNVNAPGDAFEPPAGTRIELVGEPDAVVERLTDGAIRITSVPAGIQTIRIAAPGFDTLEQIVRVPFDDTADAGALAITPLGSLELRVTGGQSSPVADAQIFVAPDPVVYASGAVAPRFEPSGDVVACSRTITLDGEQETLDGVCVSTDAVGDASFRQTFSSGAYVLATPVNDPATDAADQEATRASTVPLDHEVLVRRVDIESGGTVRLDLTLRRFAIISGVIRRPAGDGLERVDVDAGDIEFQLIDPDDNNAFIDPYPPGIPVPRISFDDNSDLEIGEYRIDRIPADSGDTQYVWRLVIRADGDEFILGPGSTRDPVQGLQYNEIRTITALLTPQPQAVRFVATYDAVGSADPQPVPGSGFRITGTSDFLPREDDPSAFDLQITTCPGDGCEISEGDGEFFNFESAASPAVESRAGTGLWLRGDAVAPVGEFRIPPFLRPGEATVSFDANGFGGISDEVLDIEAPEGEFEGDDIVIERTLVATPRNVTGTVALDPGVAGTVGLMAPFDIDGGGFSVTDVYASIEVTLSATGVALGPLPVGADGSFSFAGVQPGSYRLSITTKAGQAPALIEDVVDRPVTVPPGSAFLALSAATTAVDQLGVIRADAIDAFDGAPLAGATVRLEQRLAATFPFFFPTIYTSYVPNPDEETCETGAAGCLAGGSAFFTELPRRDDVTGRIFEYRWIIEQAGYEPRSGQDSFPDIRLDPVAYRQNQATLDRFGEVTGTLRGQIASDNTDLGTIDDATVTLVDAATRLPIPGASPLTIEAGDGGAFTFANTLEIPPRTGPISQQLVCDPDPPLVIGDCVLEDVLVDGDRYALRFEAPGYATGEATEYTFAFNTAVPVPADDAVLDALPGSLVVDVTDTDGTTTLEARVEVYEAGAVVADGGSLFTAFTTDGTAAIDPLEPRPYRLLVTAGTRDAAGTFTPADRPTLEVDTEVFPDRTTTVAAVMPPPLGLLSGSVELELFAGSSEPTDLSGVSVRAVRNSNAGGGPVDETVETDINGLYTLPPLREGEYTVTFSLDGYGTVTRNAVTVDSDATATISLVTLTADTVFTTVTVDSDRGGALTGVEVTATYDGSAPAPASSPFSAITNASGRVGFDLPPVDWVFTTDRATTLDPPHNDLLAPGQALSLAVDAGTASETLTLERYARITGTTLLRPLASATATGSDAVTVTAGAPTVEVFTSLNASGDFELYVPQPDDLTLTFEADGYQNETRQITQDALSPGDLTVSQVPLTALSRPVDVIFESSANNGSLTGISASDVNATVTFAGITDEFIPADGDIDISTSGPRLIIGFDALPPGELTVDVDGNLFDQRHDDPSVSVDVPLWVESSGADRLITVDPPITVTRLVRVEGQVVPRYVAGGDPKSLPTDAAVTVTVGGTDLDVAFDSGTGVWSVLAPRVGVGEDVLVSASGTAYTTTNVTVPAPSTDQLAAENNEVEVVLIAEQVAGVTVTVDSADPAVGGLNGVTVVATYIDTAVPAITPRESITTTVDAVDGIATFTLPPGDWDLTTQDGELALDGGGDSQPHGDQTAPVGLPVPLGGPAPAEGLTLDPFVEISGTVEPVAFLGGPGLTTFADAGVTITDGSDTFTGIVGALTDGRAPWSASIPPNTTVDVTLAATDYDAMVIGSVAVETVDVTVAAAQIAATRIDVTVRLEDAGTNDPLSGIDVIGTYLEEPVSDLRIASSAQPESASGTTDADGLAVLGLPPGSSAIETVNASGYHDAKLVPTGSQVLAPTVVVPLGGPSPALEVIGLNSNSVLLGTSVEQRGDTLTPVAGVEVIVERDGERYSAISGEVNEDGHNYRVKARSGIWRITAIHNGELFVVDEAFEIRKDEPGSEPNRLQIVVPTRNIALEGQVVDDTGQGVEGAQVQGVSAIGTVTTTTDADGRYSLDGLDNTVTWAVTFTPPAELDAQPVTRWIALNGDETADVQLDQRLPVGLGEIELRLSGGQPASTVAITLSESTPFPTLNAEGRIDVTTRLDAAGAALVRFEHLVPGDGRSVPQGRFTLEIVAPDADVVVRTGLDVGPGQTTLVEVDLAALIDLSRDVELTLIDAADEAPITNRTVTLENGTTTVPGTVEPDTNRYRFAAVDPGSWQVVVTDYALTSVDVPEGDGLFTAELTLTPEPTAEESVIAPDGDVGTTSDGTTHGGTTDAGSTDGGSTDGGTTDGGSTDGGTTDGGSTDGGTTDGGTTNAGSTDGGTTDGGSTDAGTTDAGTTDAGTTTDAGSTDAGTVGDQTPADTTATDSGATEDGVTGGGTPQDATSVPTPDSDGSSVTTSGTSTPVPSAPTDRTADGP